MGVLDTITTIVTLTSKATSAISSGVTIYEVASKPGARTTGEKVQIGVEGVFCVLQILEFGVHGTSKFAPKFSAKLCGSQQNLEIVNLSARVVTGVSDTARIITQKALKDSFGFDDFVDVAAVIVFRASDVASHLHSCETLCANKEPVKYTAAALDVLSTGVIVYRNADKISKATRAIINFVRKRPHPVPNSDAPVVPIIVNAREAGHPNAEEIEREHESFLRSVIDWENLNTIPSLLEKDPGLALYPCAITKKPVRFPVIAKDQDGVIIYEKAKIEELLNASQNPPPGWPNDLPFTAQNVEIDKDAQYRIELRLQTLAGQFKQELDSE